MSSSSSSNSGRRQTLGDSGRPRAPSVADVAVGQTVEVQGAQGTVRFAGATDFASGKWIGVELASAAGKNDGTVNGKRYFDCAPNHGLFVRQSQVKVVGAVGAASVAGAAGGGSGGGGGGPMARRQTINPGRGVAASRLGTPLRRVSDVQGLGAGRAVPGSLLASPAVSSRSTAASSPSPSPLPPVKQQQETGANDDGDEDDDSAMAVDTPAASGPAAPAPAPVPAPGLPAPAPADQPEPDDATAQQQLSALRVKYRFLEQKRSADRQQLLQYEQLPAELEQVKSTRAKLAQRFDAQQEELRALRQQVRQAEAARDEAEARAADALDAAELQTVDREVAEERAEALAAEAGSLRSQLAAARQPGGAAAAAGDGAGAGDAEQNARLKEALVRLRDMAAASEATAAGRIRQLERALAAATQAQDEGARQRERAAAAEAQVEDLRARLDDALGAEELVERLGARNLDLGQRVAELQAAVESLEALCEVNDEMDETRGEEEQRLRAELVQAREHVAQARARCARLEEAAADAQYALGRYRELVGSLQADVARLSAAAEHGERAAAHVTSQTQEMLSLGLQLRATATRSRAAAVDLALRRLDAEQAAQQLRLTEPFVPDAFFASEAGALRAVLALRRLAAKAEIAGRQLDADAEAGAEAGAGAGAAPGPDARALEARAQLARVAAAAHAAGAGLAHCGDAAFVQAAQGLAADALAAERRVDGVLALVRAEEFRPADALAEVRRVAAQADACARAALAACGDAPRVAAMRAAALAEDTAAACDVALAAPVLRAGAGAEAEADAVRRARAAAQRAVRRLLGAVRVDAAAAACVARAAEAAAALHALAAADAGADADADDDDDDDAMDGSGGSGAAERARQAASAVQRELDGAMAALDAGAAADAADEPEPPAPWERRAQAFKAGLVASAEAERRLAAQREEVVSLARELKQRDQRVQDGGVRAAMLEKRVDELRRAAADVQALQAALDRAQGQAAAYDEALATLQAEYDKVERECRQLRMDARREITAVAAAAAAANGGSAADGSAALPADLLGLRAKVAALMEALAAVRRENARLRQASVYAPAVEALRRPLLPARAGAEAEDAAQVVSDARGAAREALRLASMPRLVRLQPAAAGWAPLASRPQFELYRQQTLAASLESRVERVHQRLRALASSRRLAAM
ncbi:hypothetical protein LPJ53_000885 [Coemansia erecta]|uniref:CAP-Gly domain-containing protein n=1 Tax=Coemansia erecta TaxID=147472 RepID=A0A9W8CVH4_9FUNG|nr:hypothetical protein LPJ53_000885 [Coemansia erecta]